MTTTAAALLRGLFTKTLACTRCGSDNVFPAPGPFGALASLIGFERHLCRPCGRPFWLKASAEPVPSEERARPEGEDLGELLAAAPEAEDEETALDLEMSSPEPEPVDLAALDAEFERRCAEARPSTRQSAVVLPSTEPTEAKA